MGMMKYPPPIALVAVLSWNVGLCAASAQGATTASAPAPQAPAAQLDLQGHVTFCDRYAASEFDVQSPVVGLPFNRIDPKAAIPACREALSADPHSARLSYQLGRAYAANGDYSKALEFFSKAADAHFALAQLNVGALYFSGLGASKDDQKAAKWIQLAADQGLAPAEGNLGEMYLTGQGVAQDYGQAAHWLDLAAAQGYAPAQASLATLYAAGLGVKQDFDHARAQSAGGAARQRFAQHKLVRLRAAAVARIDDVFVLGLAIDGYDAAAALTFAIDAQHLMDAGAEPLDDGGLKAAPRFA